MAPADGHFSVHKNYKKVKERFFWISYHSSMELWCDCCGVCQQKKGRQRKNRRRQQIYNVGGTFERVVINIMGPLPQTSRNNRYIMVVIDYFTNFHFRSRRSIGRPHLLVIWSTTSNSIRSVQSFRVQGVQSTTKMLGSNKTRTTTLHPQSDGMAARFNPMAPNGRVTNCNAY
jgi:Integrase zinc binding domain